jgi:hypothetical protein
MRRGKLEELATVMYRRSSLKWGKAGDARPAFAAKP